MAVRIINADVMEGLRQLPDESVHCVVTSPPYWGLRDYGVAGQIGLESSPEAFVGRMVEVFREVRRVLRSDGTLWLNLGDSFAAGGVLGRKDTTDEALARRAALFGTGQSSGSKVGIGAPKAFPAGLKPKDLIGIPWRVAFALQADGWWLRRDIIWHKPNPMPESVTDRPTSAHEYVFLLTKSASYYYDAEAIKEPRTSNEDANGFRGGSYVAGEPGPRTTVGNKIITLGKNEASPIWRRAGFNARWNETEDAGLDGMTRNKRSVWTVATAPYKDAHFATFPPALIEPMILAGCPVRGTVLDPFSGAGTTCLVSDRLQRNGIGIELNPDYVAMSERRINGDAPLFTEVKTA